MTEKVISISKYKKNRQYTVAVVGATGSVGRTMLRTLHEREFPASRVIAIASSASAGKEVSYGDDTIIVQDLAVFDFRGVDIALFSAGSGVSSRYAEKAAAAGCIVIDNSSCWRQNPDVPLIVPEVNLAALSLYQNKGIIANPNCVAIPLAAVMQPIHQLYPINRAVVATYQSVSGKGNRAMLELYAETQQHLGMDMGLDGGEEDLAAGEAEEKVLPSTIGFNVIPQVGDFLNSGETEEEQKIRQELQKMVSPDIRITATCVRVPVFIGHSMALNLELAASDFDLDSLHEHLTASPILSLSDPMSTDADGFPHCDYITPIDCVGMPTVYVSRLRRDPSHPAAINLWVVTDNLYKGAALNAVQIAEALIKTHL